ncbi:Hypothetical predicted protein [Marmota monax]|uniref:Uncharacterized protein n=1 Tax=Marmota monax TaxID=9995 RepID=A0A5E4BDH4_MARMO|nr:hypothetical protein GHT09_006998 [Marmota monax]VTJ67030.1 Hypothetical predicted protein [Marmota monax]
MRYRDAEAARCCLLGTSEGPSPGLSRNALGDNMGGPGTVALIRCAPKPSPTACHLEVLDTFAQENIYSLYKYNFTQGSNVPPASVSGPKPPIQLHGIHLPVDEAPVQLAQGGLQTGVGVLACCPRRVRLVMGSATAAVVTASTALTCQEWYRFHYMDVLALLPTAWEDGQHSNRGHIILSCHYDSKDCQVW